MPRRAIVIALILGWCVPAPAAAALWHELTSRPELPTTLTEQPARASVQWVSAAPAADNGFAGFLTGLRSFLAIEEPGSRSSVIALISGEGESAASEVAQQDRGSLLPVRVGQSRDQSDVVEVFLGVDLQLFLNRLFSVVLGINETALSERRGSRRENQRTAYSGAGVGSLSSPSTGMGFGSDLGTAPYGSERFTVLNDRFAVEAIRMEFPAFPGPGAEFEDRMKMSEVKERVVGILFHPLLMVAAILAAIFSILWKLHGFMPAAHEAASGRRGFSPAEAARPGAAKTR